MVPDFPSRPKFSWDLRTVPWTDAKGNQEKYAEAVKQWKSFHDKLPDTNNTKIPKDLQGIMLQSQLYGRAHDLCKGIDDKVISSTDGADAIVKVVYKRDPLAVVDDVYQDFLILLNTKRGTTESFKNFASRFEATVSRFNAHSSNSQLPDALVSFMLLANANVDRSQRVSVLAAAAPRESEYSNASTTDQFLAAVKYNSVSSVLRQCDRPKTHDSDNRRPLHGNSALVPRGKPPRSGRRTLTPEQLADLKSKSTCNLCHQLGHWETDHDADGNYQPKRMTEEPRSESRAAGKTDKKSKNTLSFNMARTHDTSALKVSEFVGPLLDDAAPYSGVGEEEFWMLQALILPSWNGLYEPLPDEISDRPLWQYGSGNHSSSSRRIIGSVRLTPVSDEGNPVEICHLIIKGSSQWVIGRNVTRRCNILHMNCNLLQLPPTGNHGSSDFISLVNEDLHCYIPFDAFCSTSVPRKIDEIMVRRAFCATLHVHSSDASCDTAYLWNKIKSIINKIHHHVCGQSNFNDIKVLLQRKKLWNLDAKKYLSFLLDGCSACDAVMKPKRTRPVSLSAMTRGFNDVVCVDHMILDEYKIFHIMDSVSRYSAGAPVSSTGMKQAIFLFESHWITPFWTPHTVIFDPAFKNTSFIEYMNQLGIKTRPIPRRRHNKNTLEAKHRVIRDIFLRLQASDESKNQDTPLLITQAIRISNELYGNDVMSAHELAKGYTRPVTNESFPVPIPDEILEAHNDLIAKRKLNLMLRSKAVRDIPVSVGDHVKVSIKKQFEKRGRRTAPKPILRYDHPSRTITVPGANGRTISAAVEDVRASIPPDTIAHAVQEAMDDMDVAIDEAMQSLPDDDPDGFELGEKSSDDAKFDGINDTQENFENDAVAQDADDDVAQDDDDDVAQDDDDEIAQVDDDAVVQADDDEVAQVDDDAVVQTDDNEVSHIDDDNVEDPLLYVPPVTRAEYRTARNLRIENPTPSRHSMQTRQADKNRMQDNEVQISPAAELELTRQEREPTCLYHDKFKGKEFLLHQAEGLPSFVTENACRREEQSFKKTVKEVHISKVPKDVNIITSHVLYKIKTLDDTSLLCKARISPHGNKDKEKHLLKTQLSVLPTLGTSCIAFIVHDTALHFDKS